VRNPAGWNSRTVAAEPATRSGSADGENMLGSMAARNSSDGSAAASRQKRNRSVTTSGGSEPAHPA
jgi:hypothetical protein